MPKIEGFSVKNYGVLKDVTLGKLWNTPQANPLTPLTTVIGKNGVGKSSLSDAFGFIADCLEHGVEAACDARGRGGFERIRSQGADGPIEFAGGGRSETRRGIALDIEMRRDGLGPATLRYAGAERLNVCEPRGAGRRLRDTAATAAVARITNPPAILELGLRRFAGARLGRVAGSACRSVRGGLAFRDAWTVVRDRR